GEESGRRLGPWLPPRPVRGSCDEVELLRRGVALWTRRTKFWLPALLFVAVNLVLLAAHQIVVLVRVAVQDQAIERAAEQLDGLSRSRAEVEAALDLAQQTELELVSLRHERFATQSERLTRMMLEVKDLARRSGLSAPNNIRYADVDVEDLRLTKKEIQFTVTGTYQDVRSLINLIELSPSFLVLEAIQVGDSDQGRLTVGLTLSTLFEDVERSKR
ncbi:MAG: hypothetical protein K8J08_07745, partial [Thermoanaerobaculia bacterium]|nr:hypothetical protein [Thermoanaerobaculia bacterium]